MTPETPDTPDTPENPETLSFPRYPIKLMVRAHPGVRDRVDEIMRFHAGPPRPIGRERTQFGPEPIHRHHLCHPSDLAR
jgi:hypothetical protein